MADKKAEKPARQPSPVKNGYLILYNAASAILWLTVLGRIVGVNAIRGPQFAYPTVGEFCKWTQTLAGMEVLHSLFGIVRAPLFTTLMQVFSRYAIVWGVTGLFPQLGASPAYGSMLLAWSVTEVIRYSYFALTLSGWRPAALHWLRYHAFFVLYPLGISSEAWLIWRAVEPARHAGLELYGTALFAYVAFVYPPSAYILYTHMMAQRRKVLKAADTKANQ
ncbi:putative 3-hydroxy acyl- dehydratase [Rosellinia necatrix]|uniref:Very-long-chain (3R)-3-hydroxyacyl-CoA dehydratase n=1 Tax=Rosellinia necatrix TaxID=77044 RepID=A0A1W2TES2_ROSNE|nr:putative 3-hydroxy acyl- dehydratase [Rosellinia necatrix]